VHGSMSRLLRPETVANSRVEIGVSVGINRIAIQLDTDTI
jgi:hypothetical protein